MWGARAPADAPHCEYTELGAKIKEQIFAIPQHHDHVQVIAAEVMPEHLHMLLFLRTGNRRHLGQTIAGFMGGCTHAYWDALGIDWHINRFDSNAYASNIPDRDRDHTRSYRGPALFVRGYNDTVPITPADVQTRIAYIRDQAEKRLIRGVSHECFRIYRQQRTRSWSTDVQLQTLATDPMFGNNAAERQKAWTNIQSRLLGGDAPYLDYVGNKQLLQRGTLLPLICHRADAHRFEEQRQATLAAARSGAIIVSAFISPRENDIRHQLLVEQLPFVEIIDNGIPDRYKPIGKHFYACAENRLLQFSCWTYQYQRDVKVKREMCLVMNQLARVICRRDEWWWKER